MDSVAGRIFSACIFTAAFVGMFYFFFSDILMAAVASPQQVIVKDVFKPDDGSHTASGMVVVPSDCFEVKLRTEEYGKNIIGLVIETWQAPYRTCTQKPTVRLFSATVFAAQDVQFVASMDGTRLPTHVIQE